MYEVLGSAGKRVQVVVVVVVTSSDANGTRRGETDRDSERETGEFVKAYESVIMDVNVCVCVRVMWIKRTNYVSTYVVSLVVVVVG